MEGMSYLYELCETLPRCGPGENTSTRRAFQAVSPPPKNPLILDIGCGTGVHTTELAKISGGKIIALDNHQAFLDILMERAEKEGVEKNIVPKNMSMLDMDFEKNTFDIIWSEGALYCMGFQNGLKKCRELLKDKGFLAVSELVYTNPHPPEEVVDYFLHEYPDIKHIQENIDVIQAEGFHLITHFSLPDSAWTEPYYDPMEKEISRLEHKYHGNELALSVFENFREEIHIFKRYSDFFGYEFFIMQKPTKTKTGSQHGI